MQTLLELAAAIATKHRVGVAVDQARCDPGSGEVMHLGVFACRQLTERPDPLYVRS
ncbi:hypothetical protein GCM10008969_01840 [Pseudomonas veronii subsp. inensis]